MRKTARRAVVKHQNFQGLDLAIEFMKGGKRPYTDEAGKEHFKTMHADYGEVKGTEGLDGDAVDVYVGPDKTSDQVFVITQMKRGDWSKVDEEKCVLGVHSISEAKRLYLKHYNDPRFCGSIKEMSMKKFQERLATKGAVGEKIASSARRIAELNYLRMQDGNTVLVGDDHGVKVATVGDVRFARTAERPEANQIDTFLKRASVALPGPDSDWDVDMPADVKRKLRKEAPVTYEDRRRSALPDSDVVRQEQLGIGIPERRVVGNPKDSKMRKAAALAAVNLYLEEAAGSAKKAHEPSARLDAVAQKLAARGESSGPSATTVGDAVGAAGGYAATRSREKKSALSERASRIADRIDDVGIATLASPYIAGGLAKRLKSRPGLAGVAGRGLQAYHDNFPSKNRKELMGLALVAPGITHNVAKGVDKAIARKTAAQLKSALAGPVAATAAAAATKPGVLSRGLRMMSRGAGAGIALGALGMGAGIYGAKRMLGGHRDEGISPPAYQPPRLF
jgi:inorganic pyrophosphatase